MRTNITNNLIPNNYFIRRKKPIYIDSTNKIFIKNFGSDCSNLEIIYKNQSNTLINQNLKDIVLSNPNNNNQINGVIFETEFPNYFNTGCWKTSNNNYACDNINDVQIEYPINIISPNLLIANNQDYIVNFNIEDDRLFNDQDIFSVYLIQTNPKSKETIILSNKITFNKNIKNYQVKIDSNSIIFKKDNKYYIGLQSKKNNKMYRSNPQKYMYVSTNANYSNIEFNANKQNLNYVSTINSNLLINCYVAGLTINTYFNIKICDFNDTIPIYYSPNILFSGDKYYCQEVIIPDMINYHKYNIELIYNNLELIDLKCCINITFDYSYQVNILNINDLNNINQTSSFYLFLYVDQWIIILLKMLLLPMIIIIIWLFQ